MTSYFRSAIHVSAGPERPRATSACPGSPKFVEVSGLSPFDALSGAAGPVHESLGSRWAPDGVGLRKLDAGWRPGSGPRPVAPIGTFECQRPR